MKFTVISRLYTILIDPPARIKDVARRYKSRLLNVFLLSFLVAFAGVDASFFFTLPLPRQDDSPESH